MSARLGRYHHLSKLNENDAMDIARQYYEDKITSTKLAKMYGITQAAIWQIICGKTWSHVTGIDDAMYSRRHKR